jgi:hypothetical protein
MRGDEKLNAASGAWERAGKQAYLSEISEVCGNGGEIGSTRGEFGARMEMQDGGLWALAGCGRAKRRTYQENGSAAASLTTG